MDLPLCSLAFCSSRDVRCSLSVGMSNGPTACGSTGQRAGPVRCRWRVTSSAEKQIAHRVCAHKGEAAATHALVVDAEDEEQHQVGGAGGHAAGEKDLEAFHRDAAHAGKA